MWVKCTDGTVAIGPNVLTKEDLLEGIRILEQETPKPIFNFKHPLTGKLYSFQKQNEKVKYRVFGEWCKINFEWFHPQGEWHSPEVFRAYANALES